MALLDGRPAWHELAGCRSSRVDFFATDPESIERARAICDRCRVQYECLDDALEHPIPYGIRAGLTGPERRELR